MIKFLFLKHYFVLVSNRQSVLVDVPELQAGSTAVSFGYRFMDLGSCAGGINRRDTAVIFTLEWE